jgi:hypothetical protein
MKRLSVAAPGILLLGAILLGGCAAAGLTVASAGAGVAMGSGVEHTLNGIAFKTFTAPADDVRLATLDALRRMDIALAADEKTDEGWRLAATARDRMIDIDIEGLTRNLTRVRVVANKGDIFFKDAATGTEVILQVAHALDERAVARRQEKPPPTGKQAATKSGKRT